MSNRNGNRATRERARLDFAKIKTTVQIPNLIDVQKKSYQRFLQMDLLPSEREDTGLQSVFASVFPIQDFRGLSQLDFVDYAIGNWECKCGHFARPAPLARHLPELRSLGRHESLQDRRRAVHQVRHVQ
jgi:DNA-directed RNA polymerase subunit beta